MEQRSSEGFQAMVRRNRRARPPFMPWYGRSRRITAITLDRLHCCGVKPAPGLLNEAVIPGERDPVEPHPARSHSANAENLSTETHAERRPQCLALHLALLSLLRSRCWFGPQPLRAFVPDCAVIRP